MERRLIGRRRRGETTPEQLREQALAELRAVDEEALRLLQAREETAERLERRADDLELAQRVEERRDEIAREAASLAQAALAARAAAAEASGEADGSAERILELAAELERREATRREQLREIEVATAAGELARAAELEASLPSDDVEQLRSQLALARERENEARNRAAKAEADAEQRAAAAAACRAALARVEDELRGEYEERRHRREMQATFRRLAFEQREQAYALVVLVNEQNRKPPAPEPSSADEIARDISVIVDAEGRYRGIDLPFPRP